ncbi:hypothetical protein GW17_00023805 [Ensete ventricosum]|nr:hypothetical protein GW17_00023805 [Ensete ventricosum]
MPTEGQCACLATKASPTSKQPVGGTATYEQAAYRSGQWRPLAAKEALARGSQAWPRPAPLQGRPTTYKGVAGCSQVTLARERPVAAKAAMQRGDRLRQGPLQKVRSAAARASPQRGGARLRPRRGGCCQRSTDDRPRSARKGRSTAGSTLAGRQPAGKGTARMGCRLQGRLPTTVAPIEVPAAGVAAPWQSGCRRARAAVACAGVAAAMTQ